MTNKSGSLSCRTKMQFLMRSSKGEAVCKPVMPFLHKEVFSSCTFLHHKFLDPDKFAFDSWAFPASAQPPCSVGTGRTDRISRYTYNRHFKNIFVSHAVAGTDRAWSILQSVLLVLRNNFSSFCYFLFLHGADENTKVAKEQLY